MTTKSTQQQSSVRVSLLIGAATFARATADVFDRGVLTISSIDDARYLAQYPDGSWIDATVYDAAGHVLFGFTARQEATR